MIFIAEVGINHNGSLENALELIDVAKAAGADVVKFQKRTPELCVPEEQKNTIKSTPWGDMTYLEYKYRMEFGKKEYDTIDAYCRKKEIKWAASVWDIPSLEFILQYDIPFIKIPSACITDMQLLEAVNNCRKPVVMSTGMSTPKEVNRAVLMLQDVELTLLHCNSSYPSADNELDLSTIRYLRSKYHPCKVGYSGHEEGIIPTVIARALGAEVIERHITLDKDMWGSDHKASLNPEELEELIDILNNVDKWIGKLGIRCYPSEEKVKKKLRKE
jgi:N-acetylneuraminate synthase